MMIGSVPAANREGVALRRSSKSMTRSRQLSAKDTAALNTAPSTSLDRYEWAIVEFIRRWHRFGGGSAQEIFEEFGLGEQEFFMRVLDLFHNVPADILGVTALVHSEIRKICRWRLHVCSPRRRHSISG